MTSGKVQPAIDRFRTFYTVNGDGCWIWHGAINNKGYGQFSTGQQRKGYAHRWSYEYHVGPIREGLQIDHLCRVRSCVNPDHLEAVTPLQNMHRSPLNPIHKTHCSNGHPFDDANTYVRPDGMGRQCKACSNDRGRNDAKRAARIKERNRLIMLAHTSLGMSQRDYRAAYGSSIEVARQIINSHPPITGNVMEHNAPPQLGA